MTNEWRCFFLGEEMIASGFYWSQAEFADEMGRKVAQNAAEHISPNTNFFVVDVAKTADGGWIVIEVNDGQMSGLSTIDPYHFYEKLKEQE